MNKEDLIKKYESLEGVWNANGAEIARQCFLRDLEQLNEIDTKKVTIPQFVADWIEKCKSKKRRLHEALTYTPFGVNGWISNPKNQEIFAHAWLDGYTVEKEKRYLVKMKGLGQNKSYLSFNIGGVWLFRNEDNFAGYRTHHTRKELEEAGFGEVFNSPLFEVEEVE